MAPKMSAAEKSRRDERIVSDRIRGLTFRTLALRYGLEERQCRRIVKEHHQVRMADHDWVEEALDQLEQHEAVVERLALIVETTAHDAVRLGALKAQLAAMRELRELMRAVGFIPADLGLTRAQIDTERIAEAIFRVFDRHRLGPKIKNELIGEMTAALHGRPSPHALEA